MRKKQILYLVFQALWLLAVVVVGIPGLILVFAALTHTNIGIPVSEPVRTLIGHLMGVIALVGIFSGIAASIIKPKPEEPKKKEGIVQRIKSLFWIFDTGPKLNLKIKSGPKTKPEDQDKDYEEQEEEEQEDEDLLLFQEEFSES